MTIERMKVALNFVPVYSTAIINRSIPSNKYRFTSKLLVHMCVVKHIKKIVKQNGTKWTFSKNQNIFVMHTGHFLSILKLFKPEHVFRTPLSRSWFTMVKRTWRSNLFPRELVNISKHVKNDEVFYCIKKASK